MRKYLFFRLIPVLIGLFLALAWTAGGSCAEAHLRILCVNDFHGFAEPHQPPGAATSLGGVANLAGAIDRLRTTPAVLPLAAGDMIQGNDWANLFRGKSVMDVMNAMRFDAMVVGNHEFDFGPEVLRQRIRQAKFPLLGANVAGFAGLRPYVIKNLPGVRVAIIGVVTPDTPGFTHPRNVTGLNFIPPETAVQKYLPELKEQAEVIIVLSHLGFQADRGLAQAVPGIDVIVGGHSHTKLLQPAVVDNTIIMQAWEQGKALGVLDLHLQEGKIVKFAGRLQEITPDLGRPDPKVQKIVARYRTKAEAVLNREVGETAVNLEGEGARGRETNLGDRGRLSEGAEAGLSPGRSQDQTD